jgi:hypothetical protein
MQHETYLDWAIGNTPTTWWHDSADPAELDRGLEHGAVGVTTNPVLSFKSLTQNRKLWSGRIDEVLGRKLEPDMKAEELVRIAIESEGPNCLGATARLAHDQIASLTGKHNEPLPDIDQLDVRTFDDPPFCVWAEKFCRLLQDRRFKQAHRCLSSELGTTMTQASLKSMWSSMLGSSRGDTMISLESFELSSESGDERHVGWCYLSVTNDEINEAISMDVYRTATNAYEIRSLEFGRP